MSAHELSVIDSTGRRVELTVGAVPDDAADRLEHATVTVLGRMRNASNATFLARLSDPDGLAIYKPGRGERPLWDFGPGLYRREVAAFVLSEALGLSIVPPTVMRADAPLGEGSLQWFVNADFSHHYFSLYAERPDLHDQLRRIAVFDVLANNTDRKSGHCLLEPGANGDRADHVWAIDNGLCFSSDEKLRTVIWEFAGDTIPADLRARAATLAERIPFGLTGLLDEAELLALSHRARWLADTGRFPAEPTGHGYPWPLV